MRWTVFCAAVLTAFGSATVQAQPDYPPAIWNQAYPGHWYTSGNGHFFCVIHDMEGYYEATISYFQQPTQGGSNSFASIYYCVNGLYNGIDTAHGHTADTPADGLAGEITQMVREQFWAWHVLCWNTYMFGTEHEGFVDSPVWYTEQMYQASAGITAASVRQLRDCHRPQSHHRPQRMAESNLDQLDGGQLSANRHHLQ